MPARRSFLQSTPDYDFFAKELSIPINLLRLQVELQSGYMPVFVEADWPWKL